MADKVITMAGDWYAKTAHSVKLSNTVNKSEVQQYGADPTSVNTVKYESEQFYSPATRKAYDGVRVPIVYGTTLTKGVVIDVNTSVNTGDPTTEYKNIKFLMSEGPTAGIETAQSNKEAHIIINQNSLIDPTTAETELAGVRVKDVKTPVAATWPTSTQVSTKSNDVSISIFATGTTNLDDTVRRKRHLLGLADVSGEGVNGAILRYNGSTKKFEVADLGTTLNELPLVVVSDQELGTTFNEEKWLLPSTNTLEVTWDDDTRITEAPFRWWKNDAKPVTSIDDTNKGVDGDSDGTRESIHFNGFARPDIIMYQDVTYTFNITSTLPTGYGLGLRTAAFTSSLNLLTGTTAGVTTGSYTFKPTASTDRILYYGTQTGSFLNDGGRILVRAQ